MTPIPKKFLFRSIYRILSTERIRTPISAFMAKHPRLKQRVKNIAIRYFVTPRIQGLNNRHPHDHGLKPTATYQNLLNYTLLKNTYNIQHTSQVNEFILALNKEDYPYLTEHNTIENQQDLIISCYLYLLRRYPSQNDIDMWTDHLRRGASVETILNSLMGSLEFSHLGIYHLNEV